MRAKVRSERGHNLKEGKIVIVTKKTVPSNHKAFNW